MSFLHTPGVGCDRMTHLTIPSYRYGNWGKIKTEKCHLCYQEVGDRTRGWVCTSSPRLGRPMGATVGYYSLSCRQGQWFAMICTREERAWLIAPSTLQPINQRNSISRTRRMMVLSVLNWMSTPGDQDLIFDVTSRQSQTIRKTVTGMWAEWSGQLKDG